MSIRSRIATFEARNQELRNAVRNKGDEPLMTTATVEPRIVTPSNSSVAGRFGSTIMSQKAGGRGTEQSQQHTSDDIDEPPRVQRYQPLHQQYHQRQAQQRSHKQRARAEQSPRLEPPEGAEEQSPLRPVVTENGSRISSRSPHRRAQHQRRLEHMRRIEDNQRRLHETQQQPSSTRYLPDPKRKDDGLVQSTSSSPRTAQHHDGETASPGNKFAKTTTAQRLAKIQRMQRNRSMEKVRRNHQATRLEDYERPPSPGAVPRDLSLQPSAADDEITLTSVRQIVGTTTAHSGSPPGKTHVYPDEMTYTDDRDWPEEKSDKNLTAPMRRSASSSSDEEEGNRRQSVPAITSQLTPDVASFFAESQRRFLHPNSPHHNDDEQASQGSESFAQRKERERLEQVAREAAVQKAKAEMEGPFLKPEDVDYYQKSVDTRMAKTAAGVAVAATVGCVVLGPVGLLVGAAAVGIGVGVMQIPAEQRQNLEEKASRTLRQVSDTALQASESLSTSCVNTYQDSGLADHVPDEVNNCCAAIREAPTTDKSEMSVSVGDTKAYAGEATDVHDDIDHRAVDEPPTRLPPRRAGAACLRVGTFTPVNLIYTLNPSDQPRAWLDVLASAETTHDEKMEALEEIMILAKDKSRARILVEEGILDSIMWTLGRYFEKLYGPEDSQQLWAHPEIMPQEARMAKLSANCCLQLGKAYCAAMHTDGDLMLMSLYERGTVPEERQLAQMLHEVPYHTRVTKTKDPTVVDPAGEVFAVVQLSLPQAEEFARSVKALAHGQSYQM